jgi:hypothetical protein
MVLTRKTLYAVPKKTKKAASAADKKRVAARAGLIKRAKAVAKSGGLTPAGLRSHLAAIDRGRFDPSRGRKPLRSARGVRKK